MPDLIRDTAGLRGSIVALPGASADMKPATADIEGPASVCGAVTLDPLQRTEEMRVPTTTQNCDTPTCDTPTYNAATHNVVRRYGVKLTALGLVYALLFWCMFHRTVDTADQYIDRTHSDRPRFA